VSARTPRLLPRTGLAVVLLSVGLTLRAFGYPCISWSGQRDVILGLGPDDNTTFFDLNGDGVNDFGFRNYNSTMSLVPAPGSLATATAGGGYQWYGPLNAGTMVSEILNAPLSWSSEERYLVSYMMHDPTGEVVGIGPWLGVDHGLLGVSFDIGGQTHYGWMRMSDVSETAFAVHDWAYETQPGLGINAGVVPEPSSTFVVACGLGVLGLAEWRRRRQQPDRSVAHCV